MHIEELREYCLSKKGVEESFPFDEDTLVFKVMGKIFLLINLVNPVRFNVKCDPEEAIELRERYTEVQPGYHMNKKMWNTVYINGNLSTVLLKKFIDDSYKLVVEKLSPKIKTELDRLN